MGLNFPIDWPRAESCSDRSSRNFSGLLKTVGVALLDFITKRGPLTESNRRIVR